MEPLLKDAFLHNSSILTTPSAPISVAAHLFLMAQPPLLYQEGNCEPHTPSHMTRSCPQVHFALISNSLTPVGVAFGLCSVCGLNTTPNSRNSSSSVRLP